MSYKVSQYGAYLDGSGLSISGTLPAEGTVFTTFTVPAGGTPTGTLFRFADYAVSLQAGSTTNQFDLVISNGNGEQRRFTFNREEQFTVGASYDSNGGNYFFSVDATSIH